MKKLYTLSSSSLKASFIDCFVQLWAIRSWFLTMTEPWLRHCEECRDVAIQASPNPLGITSILLCSLALGGCDTFRNTFGLDHSSPNEWNTTEPSPGLILPPDFKERPKLPPPTPGAPNPHVVPETVKAQKTVLGDDHSVDTSISTSKGEKDIIEKASENQTVTPDIRKIVDEEAQADSTVSGTIISKIQSWKKEAAENLGLSKSETASPKDSEATNKQEEESEAR